MLSKKLSVLLLATVVFARAQAPLNPPVPLAPVETSLSPGTAVATLAAAQSAQEFGFASIAAGHYRQLLGVPGVDQARVTLALATVLLDDGQPAAAEQVLKSYTGPRNAAWHLRAALAAGQQKKPGTTRAEFEAIKPAELPKDDVPWFAFLQGMLTQLEDATLAGLGKANNFYQQALDTAATEIARTRFRLAIEVIRPRLGAGVSEANLEQVRQNMENNRGRAIGYEFARIYAVDLDMAGRKGRAVEVLQDQLRRLPPTEAARIDDFRFLLGLIGGAVDGAGRNALIQLLEKGTDANKQRAALQLLARASQTGAAREQFRAELDRLIMAPTPSEILADAYFFRAMVWLAAKNYARAEDDARSLLEKFPGSPLLPHAYGVLMGSAWEQLRFRLAADYATKARESLTGGVARAELGVLIAEAWFRAGQAVRTNGASGAADFRLAAQAYTEALGDPPPDRPIAELMYQRVLAEIESGALESAEKLLDQMARDVADPTSRWQAEWNLARAMQAAGKSQEALARASRLLAMKGPDSSALPPDLRGRMAWLQAQLSFDVEPSEQTLKLIDAVGKTLDGVEEGLRNDIASTTALLQAQTFFALKRDAEALATLTTLRRDFPKSRAAIYSYMTEAEYYAQQQDKMGKAQELLTTLAKDFPDSEYAPYALFRAAAQAEQRQAYDDAERRIEQMITLLEKNPQNYPANNLVFAARMKQGDLLRKLNQFPVAQQVYQNLLNNFPQHPDVILAQLALAECHHAQSASDPSHAERAQVLLKHLNLRLDAPIDVRVEAGCGLGELLVAQGEEQQALEVWWRDVVHAFLDDPAKAASLGATGRFWMGRTLLKMGEILEREQKLEEAKQAWDFILRTKLPGESVARQQLARYNVAMEGRP